MTPIEAAAKASSALDAASRAITVATKEALADAAKVAKSELEGSGRRFTGGDLRFSGMRGARIGVRTTQRGSTLFVSPRGPWGMLEPGARAHTIKSRRVNPAMRIGDDWRRGPFQHPGTPNRRAWSTGRDETLRRVERELPKMIEEDVQGAFNG